MILKIVSLNMLLEVIPDMLSWRTCIKVVSLAWLQQILWLAGSPAWVWGGLCDECICICMVMMVCDNNENYQAKNSWDCTYASCWQMLKKKLILCHVTLNLPVTLVTWKIPNVMLRNVPVFVPMSMSIAVRGLTVLYLPSNPLQPCSIACVSFWIITRILTLICWWFLWPYSCWNASPLPKHSLTVVLV